MSERLMPQIVGIDNITDHTSLAWKLNSGSRQFDLRYDGSSTGVTLSRYHDEVISRWPTEMGIVTLSIAANRYIQRIQAASGSSDEEQFVEISVGSDALIADATKVQKLPINYKSIQEIAGGRYGDTLTGVGSIAFNWNGNALWWNRTEEVINRRKIRKYSMNLASRIIGSNASEEDVEAVGKLFDSTTNQPRVALDFRQAYRHVIEHGLPKIR